MAYLPRTVRVAFMALSCSKCDDMSVANTISTTKVRKSLKKQFITLTWKSEVDRYGNPKYFRHFVENFSNVRWWVHVLVLIVIPKWF